MPVLSTLGAMTFDRGQRLNTILPIGTFAYCGYVAGYTLGSVNITYLIASDINIPNATGFANWTTANNNCQNLVAYSCSDWRLPSRSELGTLCANKTILASIGQGFNTTPNTASSVYWSETPKPFNFYYTRLFWNCQENEAINYDFLSYRAVRTQLVPIT